MEKDIGKIKKNDMTDIVVRIDDFGGKKGVTVREYTTSERYTGFTKSGTRISPENFKEFKALINSIDEKDLEQGPDAKPAEKTAEKDLEHDNSEKPAEKPVKKSKKIVTDTPQEELF
ncbi:MAG: hypothetical protein Q8N99_00590 [Nanoarchaeota archaeon]|nr:hypothetical protein [Nanoarchaeota archaeon]